MRLFMKYLHQADPAPVTEGSLFTPAPARHGTDVSGGWRPASSSGKTKWLAATLAVAAAGWYAWQQQATPTTSPRQQS